MNILIVGATGDVGCESAKIAVEKGHKVKALIRSTSNRDKLGSAKDKIEFIEGDILDKTSLGKAMEGIDALIISIRLTPGEMKKGRTYQDVELTGVKNLVDVAKQKGVKKLIHVSAVGVGSHCVSDMYQAKHQAEETIRNSGINYTIFKPSGMFKDFRFYHVPKVIEMGETNRWPFGPVHFHMNPLSHIDLAKCMIDSLTNPKASNQSLEIGGPECITQGDLLNMIAKEAGIKANYTEGVSKEQLIEMVKNNPQKSFFSAEQIKDFINDTILDHAQIKAIFGIEFQKVGDFLKQVVPAVKASLAAKQQK
ncbi:MAG: NAD(P)H-binding protein [Candidatus Schekmanbacteria bacterium]|nr:NAD(P)H-binding protein [Candidatus Schekmanbacteria bacterium]